MKKYILIVSFIILGFRADAIHFWQPYPISANITGNGIFSRLELSVYDSVTTNWHYYNTPYFFGSIDTTNSSNSIVIFTTYTGVVSNLNKDYGFIIYDPVLHQFSPKLFVNDDPDFPGGSLVVLENSVVVRDRCCLTSSGSNLHTRAYIYDINLNDWMDDLVAYDGPTHYGGLYALKGGYVARWTDDYTYQPFDARHFYHPPNHSAPDVGFTEAMDLKGNQDLLLCQMGNFLTSDAVSVSIYDPWSVTWKEFSSYDCEYSGDESTFYLEFWNPHTKLLGSFDDSLHQWVLDTPLVNITQTISKDRIIAYVKPSGTEIQMQTYSPTLHTWVRDSVSVAAGVDSLYIEKSTVKWVDNLGVNYFRGYIDGTGWVNAPTPLQLNHKIINMFQTLGKPLIYVRSYSYGTDSVRFSFSDGGVSDYSQGSVWHQFKVNGSYGLTSFDSVEVCIETIGDSGLTVHCTKEYFSTCSVGGNLSASNNIICAQDSVSLVLSGYSGNIEWQSKTNLTNWTTISGTNNDTLVVTPVIETFYRAKVINGICPPSFSTIKIVNVVPSFLSANSIAGDFNVCKGQPISYIVDSLPGHLKFIWHFPNGFSMNNDSTSSISGYANGNSGNVTLSAQTMCGTTTPTLIKPIQVNVVDTFVDYYASQNMLSSWEWFADSYQWLSCPSYAPIPGAILGEFIPSISGSYAVEVTKGECKDTSGCWDVIIVGQQENTKSSSIELYPNPTDKTINFAFQMMMPGEYMLSITDIYGRIISENVLNIDSENILKKVDVSFLNSGVYFVNLWSPDFIYNTRFIKE
jgi:hypothetical protein